MKGNAKIIFLYTPNTRFREPASEKQVLLQFFLENNKMFQLHCHLMYSLVIVIIIIIIICFCYLLV